MALKYRATNLKRLLSNYVVELAYDVYCTAPDPIVYVCNAVSLVCYSDLDL